MIYLPFQLLDKFLARRVFQSDSCVSHKSIDTQNRYFSLNESKTINLTGQPVSSYPKLHTFSTWRFSHTFYVLKVCKFTSQHVISTIDFCRKGKVEDKLHFLIYNLYFVSFYRFFTTIMHRKKSFITGIALKNHYHSPLMYCAVQCRYRSIDWSINTFSKCVF